MSSTIGGPVPTTFLPGNDALREVQTPVALTGSGVLGDEPEIPMQLGDQDPGASRPSLAPPGNPPDGSFAHATVRLSDLRLSPDNVQELAKLSVENDLQARQASREKRAADRESDYSLQMSAADKMRSQAALTFAAAVTMSSIAIVGSAVSIAGSAKATKSSMDGPDGPSSSGKAKAPEVELPTLRETAPSSGTAGKYRFSNDAPEGGGAPKSGVDEQRAEMSAVNRDASINAAVMKQNVRAQAIQTKYSAAGSMITELGRMGGAAMNYQAAEMDAEKTEMQAQASKFRTLGEDESEFVKSYTDNIQSVIQKLAAIQESEAENMRQIIRG